ncbi:MAG: tetratricopeptide repeat protein [Cyanobacteria bacterium]|nr:tetratricopeptide repeat protein [Cyanobacteriota bacterium]
MTKATDTLQLYEDAVSLHIGGEYSDAERQYRRALKSLNEGEQVIPPSAQNLLSNNVRLLMNMGELGGALRLGQELLRMREQQFGYFHPQTASILRLLAEIKEVQSDLTGRTRDMRRALDVWMDVLGWKAPEPDPMDLDLHLMGGQRALYPNFDWIKSELARPALYADLTREQRNSQLFVFLLEIGAAFSWCNMHSTAASLFSEARLVISHVPAILIWEHYWACMRAGTSYVASNDSQGAVSFHESFLSALSQAFEDGSDVMPLVLVSLAKVKMREGDREGSRRHLEHALKLFQNLHGEDNLQVAQIHIDIGTLFREQADPVMSERHLSKAISILESWHGPSDNRLVKPLYLKGLIHKESRRYREAEKYLGRAIETLMPREPDDVKVAAEIFAALADTYRSQFQHQKALMAQLRGLDLLREHGAADRVLLARYEMRIASLYFTCAKYVDAQKNAENSLAWFESQSDKKRFRLEIGLNYLMLARINTTLFKYRRAAECLREAETWLENDLDDGDFALLEELELEHVTLLVCQGQSMKAVKRLKRVIDNEQAAALTDLSIPLRLMLVNVEMTLGILEDKETEYLRICTLAEKRGAGHESDRLRAMSALVTFYVSIQKYESADNIVEAAIRLIEACSSGSDAGLSVSPAYAGFLRSYARLLIAKGSCNVATEKLKRALGIYEKCFGSVHPMYADTWIELSSSLLLEADESASDQAAYKATTILSNIFDLDHQSVARAMAWEAFVAIKRRRFDVALAFAARIAPTLVKGKLPPDILLTEALAAVIKNEVLNKRDGNVGALWEYLSSHMCEILYTTNCDGANVLLDLMAYFFEHGMSTHAVTIGDTILEHLVRRDCLILPRKELLRFLYLTCRDHSTQPSAKELAERTAAAMSELQG